MATSGESRFVVSNVDVKGVMKSLKVARARATDPGTSHAAAASVKDGLRFSQLAVLRTLGKIRRGTDADIAEAYVYHGFSAIQPQSPSGLRTRRAELVEQGLVVDTGKRKRLPSGRQAIVWAKKPGSVAQRRLKKAVKGKAA